ncbi:MAG: hypothetical protein K2O14_06160 [Oscillospiraceae bacterium]|nr:hypothetical protein [Oscillospiraceae bacterium]
MFKVRLIALVLMAVGVAGLFPTAVLDSAENPGAVYAFGGIAFCGFVIMGVTGVYQLTQIARAASGRSRAVSAKNAKKPPQPSNVEKEQ